MPIHERKPEEKKRRRIVCSSGTSTGPGYAFARKDKVPAGYYEATLDRIVESETSKGDEAIDACYTLKKGEKNYMVLQRVADGYYLDRFNDQLMEAGVKDGTNYDEIKGIKVAVEISYNYNDFAQITVMPSKGVATQMSLLLEEDEDDDYLLEEDN